jgi:hypothetical protein
MLPDPTLPPSLMALLEKSGSSPLRVCGHPVGRGTCFVVVGIVVELPFCSRPVCLPVMARLWRPKQGPSAQPGTGLSSCGK